jgi:heme exporter protein C
MTVTATPAPVVTVTSTGTRATRYLGALALASLLATVVLGLFVSPRDEVQGDAVRMMYVHVPSAWLAYLSFFVTAAASAMYLWRRTMGWDRLAGASAEIGVMFCGLALVTGSLWGRITWGEFWDWNDARLVTTALLFMLYLGYVAYRRLGATPVLRAKRSAVAGLVAFVDVPIVHMSVYWWGTIHQKPTVLRPDLNPEIDGTMLFTLFVGVVAFTLAYFWLVIHRARVIAMEDALGDRQLDDALRERATDAYPGEALA